MMQTVELNDILVKPVFYSMILYLLSLQEFMTTQIRLGTMR